jgi:hypothetical protein
VEADADDKAGEKAPINHRRTSGGRSRLIECPFEVRIDGAFHDKFYDVRDAMASARAVKKNKLTSTVVVTDVRTGKLVIEVES